MHKLNIKVPVNSLESAQAQIEAGATELYVGYDTNLMKKITFTGRGKDLFKDVKTHVSYEDLVNIVQLAHKNNVTVELTANMAIMPDDLDGESKFQEKYLDYVKKGIQAGVDSIIVGDIGNLYFLKENGIDISISASVFLASINISQIKWLESLGVKKIVLPHHVKMEEVEAIANNSTIKIEVFGHFGCAFLQGTCSMFHPISKEINVGVPCRAKFKFNDNDIAAKVLDTAEDCSLCSIPGIIKSGANSIKITGREFDHRFSSMVTSIYSNIIKRVESGEELEGKNLYEVASEDFKMDWWKQRFCNNNRCKFKNTKYYI